MEAWNNAYNELAKLILDNVPEVKVIDLWSGQTEMFAEDFPYSLPAVFVEFNANGIENAGNNVQQVNTAITLHLALETLADTHISRNTGARNPQIFVMMGKIYSLLQGKKGGSFSSLNRKNIYKYEAAPNIMQYAQVYDGIVTDYGAQKEYIQQELNNDLQIVKNNQMKPPEEPLYDISF